MAAFPSDLFNNEVLYSVEDGVAKIVMNNEKAMNTFNKYLTSGVLHAVELAAEDDAVSVIVLIGAGRAFSAGGSLAAGDNEGASSGFKGKEGSRIRPTAFTAVRNLRLGGTLSELLRDVNKPTMAAVNGAAAGAGLSLALACDLRFASERAVFRSAFVTAGLSGDYGTTWLLPRIVGPAKAREMCILNRKVSAAEALAMGLCTQVFPHDRLLDEVMSIAKEVARSPPLALRRMKQNLNNADRETSFSAHLDFEAERHARCAFHPDAAEAGLAFAEKRAGRFQGVGGQPKWALSRL